MNDLFFSQTNQVCIHKVMILLVTSHKISQNLWYVKYYITLKFDMHLNNTTAKAHAKSQGDLIPLNPYICETNTSWYFIYYNYLQCIVTCHFHWAFLPQEGGPHFTEFFMAGEWAKATDMVTYICYILNTALQTQCGKYAFQNGWPLFMNCKSVHYSIQYDISVKYLLSLLYILICGIVL